MRYNGTMSRRKKFKIPLFSSFKIKKHTLSTAIGILIFLCGSLLLLSFIKNGYLLIEINNRFVDMFGWYSIITAFVIVLFSTHFFNSKKLTIIKVNVSIGLVLMSIAIIGLSSTGSIGNIIYKNLSQDFSMYGAVLILLSTAIIGCVIFLNTSIDTIILSIIKLLKVIVFVLKKHIFKKTIETIFSKR